MTAHGPASGRRAFTLIEVLVIVAIIGVLAGFLLPALITARERARVASCLNNLKQMGTALETYCSAFQQYFPCYPGYGLDPCDPASGVTYTRQVPTGMSETVNMSHLFQTPPPAPPAVSDVVWSNPPAGTGADVSAGFPGVNFYRTCFFGQSIIPNPTLRTAPVGLGYLILTGYLADAHTLFCPSTNNMPPDWGAANAASTLQAVSSLGAFDADTFTQSADWTRLPGTWQNIPATYGFQANYCYRNVPISNAANYADSGSVSSCQIHSVSPVLTVTVGCPEFKSQKLLGGRAVASDAFGRWDDVDVLPKNNIGIGVYGHKTAYNVLYGDGHANTCGDPLSHIMFWNEVPDSATLQNVDVAEQSSSLAGTTVVTAPNPRQYDTTQGNADYNEGFGVWHIFDHSAGIDVQ